MPKDPEIFVDFGRHKGERWTRIPVNYLIWMLQTKHSQVERAEYELDRRGTRIPQLSVSNHAIDRASQRCLATWHGNRRNGEGLCSWLVRISEEALKEGVKEREGVILYQGMRFVFEFEGEWPVLKSIMQTDNAA